MLERMRMINRVSPQGKALNVSVILYEMYLSPDMQLTLTLNNLRMRSAKNIDFVEKRKVPQGA